MIKQAQGLITEHGAAARPSQVPDGPELETRVKAVIAEVADQRAQVDAVIREMQTAASVVSLLAPPAVEHAARHLTDVVISDEASDADYDKSVEAFVNAAAKDLGVERQA